MEVQRNERLRAMLSDTVQELEEARRDGEKWRGAYERAVEEVEWEGWGGAAVEVERRVGSGGEELEARSIPTQSIPTVAVGGEEGGGCCVCVCVERGRRGPGERSADRSGKSEKRGKHSNRCWRRVVRRVRVRFERVFSRSHRRRY